MRQQQAVVRLLGDYLEVWQRQFPELHRRAHWHMVRHLCTTAREGCSAGELSGFVRQVFLLDEATVRERIGELAKQALCTLDPPDSSITARTFLAPTPLLLARFDAHLAELAGLLAGAVAAMAGNAATSVHARAERLSDGERRSLLAVIDAYCGPWRAALDGVFTAHGLSPARRQEARRHLISPSHWTLMLLATQHFTTQPAADEGLLADRMAAELLRLTGQNFQTTRDHIAMLMEIGLLRRCRGKALHVALTPAAAAAVQAAFAETAAQWPPLLRQLQTATPAPPPAAADDGTLRLRPGDRLPAGLSGHRLRIVEPPAARRHIPIATVPLTIGRAPPADLVLEGADISRAHCRIELRDGQFCVTDLKSTNGTFVNGVAITGTVPLLRGAVLTLGGYVLEYEHLRTGEQAEEATAVTQAAPPAARRRIAPARLAAAGRT